jgi:plastocyanin
MEEIMKSRIFMFSVLVMIALLAAACGTASTPSTSPTATQAPSNPASGGTQEVKIANFAFDPPSLTISVGTTVKWTNEDSAKHTATADDGSFDSGQLSKGQSFTFTFTKEGTFTYICADHANMKATIIVTK